MIKTTRTCPHWLLQLVVAGAVLLGVGAHAVVLDDDARRTITLDDGTEITLIGEVHRGAGKRGYYYLPNRLRTSVTEDGRPEFLFVKFITDQAEGGVSGALMHFLLQWGLTVQQEQELRNKLENLDENAELKGAVQMFAASGDEATFEVISAVLADEQMTQARITSGSAPLIPGGKVAVAARLDPNGGQLLATTFEEDSAITDVSAVLTMAYETQLPAAKGSVYADWSRMMEESESIEASYKENYEWVDDAEGCWLFFRCDKLVKTYSYDEIESQYKHLVENNYIRFEFEERLADERVARIREAFIQYFINTMSEPAPPPPRRPEDGEGDAIPDIRQGHEYTYTRERTSRTMERKTQRFSMEYKLTVRWPHQVVGNMKSWYAVASEFPDLVQAVNLDDPFFQRRDVIFMLDLDSHGMFEDEINHVTVDIEKPREDGAWQENVTMNAETIEDSGVSSRVTYARGEDRNTDDYRYRVQWSFRGTGAYPRNPQWQTSSWEGVTLTAPLVARTIELEGDLAELEASGLTRVTAQVRYPRLGREVEENIPLSVARGEPLVEKTIYMDRDARGYAYRLVLNHRRFDKMALPWSARVSDDYIYALIPDELLEATEPEEPSVLEAVEAAGEAVDNVLSEFEDLLGGS